MASLPPHNSLAAIRSWLGLILPLCSLIAQANEETEADAETLLFLNETAFYCPYTSCSDGRPGYVIELVEKIYSNKGYAVHIENVNSWSRAIFKTETNEVDGIVNIAKSSSPSLLYPKEAVSNLNIEAFVPTHIDWQYFDTNSFTQLRLGLVQGYGYDSVSPEFSQYVTQNKDNESRIIWITGTDPLERIFEMMMIDRLSAAIEDRNVGMHILKKMGIEDKITSRSIYNLPTIPTYIGFAPGKRNSAMLAELFDQGLRELRSNGELAQILSKYGVDDWKDSQINDH
ncbi:MAG: transporter substrate-binding domain-containing protein [Pseudomonadales bacterium]|nr:transporter substrate-binding domain-containing protein [Pseudomonadales bacterium]